ncbi:unnamed protein product [Peniophora sp. CBMAI 1063]|nr:unnamed protein product [Peniophora sp. CBMAI 1063]
MVSSLTDLPVEVLIDNVLPAVDLADLGSLAATNKTMATICADDTFWKRKCLEDFNFHSSETARTSGWKVLYRGLFRPRIFVWGERRNGRLGLQELPRGLGAGVPYPLEVRIPGHRIVSLAAAGMSFYALDSKGVMFAWGTMNGEGMAFSSDGFSVEHKTAPVPHKLIMPTPIRTVSCGRLHTVALDAKSQVWTFCNWGRPFQLASALVDRHSPDTTPVQAEAGWSFSAILTQSGDVLVYWQNSGTMGRAFTEQMSLMDRNDETKARADGQHRIPCATWEMLQDPVRLRPIPDLPTLADNGLSQEEQAEPTKLVRIAGMDNNLIGLTNKGHVLLHRGLDNDRLAPGAHWEYLPEFSDIHALKRNPIYADDTLQAPETMRITHVTAHFHKFVAYSTGTRSVILMGNSDTGPLSRPEIMPALQNRSVINVLLGDYHNAALTSDGKLLTWGSYSNGALGLGDPRQLPAGAPGGYENEERRQRVIAQSFIADPPSVTEPAEVRFDHNGEKGRKFVFAATAGGWHTGALVMSLEPEKDRLEEQEEQQMPGAFPGAQNTETVPPPPEMGHTWGPGEMPGFPVPAGGGFRGGIGGRIFRIGYAGRGMNRGAYGPGGRGRGGQA